MSFIIDRQTLTDLGIMSVAHGKAVVSLFGPARTAAGDAKLREMISSPLDQDIFACLADRILRRQQYGIPFRG